MNCSGCGNPLEKGAQFCPKCFARIEAPTLWQKFCSLFESANKPHRPIININKKVTIRTTDKDGQQHEYHSIAEVPPELRAEIEKVESELKQDFSLSSSDGLTTKIVSKKTASLFKLRDASGNEKAYHSLEEMPPEIRVAFENAKTKTKESPRDG
jgi:hypothetical protein